MEEKRVNSLPKYSYLVLAIVLGALSGVGLYQASVKGWIPFNNINPPGISQPVSQTEKVVTEQNAVIDVVKQTSPSVVAIGSTQQVYNPYDPFSSPQTQTGTIGTGFVVSPGIIVTNRHVVSDTTAEYNVVTKDGQKYSIKKIYRDPILDLAIVQVNSTDVKPLALGDSSKLQVGQDVVAIGNALGQYTNTVTTGIVSGLGRRVVAGDPYSGTSENLDNLIQTDAAINPGNSGGPLLNLAGQVIGVNVATTQGAQNIGFAIPINSVKTIVDQFVKNGTISWPFLGVSYKFVARDLALLDNVPQGDYVESVVPNSAADKAGIVQGDIIVKADGQPIDSESKLSNIITGKKVGDTLNLVIWNNGNQRNVSATLQDYSSQ